MKEMQAAADEFIATQWMPEKVFQIIKDSILMIEQVKSHNQMQQQNKTTDFLALNDKSLLQLSLDVIRLVPNLS